MNFKTKDLVNLKVEFLKGPYNKYKTKFGSDEFLEGRRIDWKEPHTDKGNFEVAEIKKGVKAADRIWREEDFDRNKFDEFFNYNVKTEDGEGFLELPWTQNQALIAAAGINQYGKAELPFVGKVKIEGKSFGFVSEKKKEEKDEVATADDLAF